MVTSKSDHLARVRADNDATMDEYRRQIEEVIARTPEETFSVPRPNSPVGDPLLKRVLDEYREAGWTVEEGSQRNDRYISFR